VLPIRQAEQRGIVQAEEVRLLSLPGLCLKQNKRGDSEISHISGQRQSCAGCAQPPCVVYPRG
jgi:hypothetical protein